MEETSINFERRIWIVIGGFVVIFLFIIFHLWMSMLSSPDSYTAYAPSHDRVDIGGW